MDYNREKTRKSRKKAALERSISEVSGHESASTHVQR